MKKKKYMQNMKVLSSTTTHLRKADWRKNAALLISCIMIK